MALQGNWTLTDGFYRRSLIAGDLPSSQNGCIFYFFYLTSSPIKSFAHHPTTSLDFGNVDSSEIPPGLWQTFCNHEGIFVIWRDWIFDTERNLNEPYKPELWFSCEPSHGHGTFRIASAVTSTSTTTKLHVVREYFFGIFCIFIFFCLVVDLVSARKYGWGRLFDKLQYP